MIFRGTAVFLMEKNIPENRALQEDTWNGCILWKR